MVYFNENNNKLFNESKIKRVFESRLKKNGISTVIFDENCKTVNVINCRKFKNDEDAMYNVFDNNLLIKADNYIDFIWHELLHMSSSVRCGYTVYSGVSAVDFNSYRIGYGLNEGITVFIDLMFFKGITKEHDIKSDSYKIEKILCGMLYDVLGFFLLECYFTADFYGLYNYLVSLNGVKKTNRFYKAFDTICYGSYYSGKDDEKRIFNAYKYAYYYLTEILVKKIRLDYEKGLIDESIYKEAISKSDICFSDTSFTSETGEKFEISKEKIRELIKKNISSI